MLKGIEILQKPRIHLLKLIDDLDIHLLNEVPAGFNNNIVWNFAHMVAAQQGVCYLRAGAAMRIDQQLHAAYKPDTRPEKFVSEDELGQIKQLFLSTLELLEEDYHNQVFANYVPWTTRYGVSINNIDEAIAFLPFHDGLHIGYIMALRRALIGRQV